MQTATLSSGRTMPMLGSGTWALTGRHGAQAVSKALRLGYRHIDTAVFYGNHQDVAAGIRDSGVPRQDIFITTKVWRDKLAYLEAWDTVGPTFMERYRHHFPEQPDCQLRRQYYWLWTPHAACLVRRA